LIKGDPVTNANEVARGFSENGGSRNWLHRKWPLRNSDSLLQTQNLLVHRTASATKSLASELKASYILIEKRIRGNDKSTNEPQKKYLIFISHSHVDSWVAGQIAAKIENAGIETFLDQEHIKAGEDFEARILQALININQIEDYIAQPRKKLSLKVN